jgi:AcrR family transcriptional regulator
LLKQVADMSVGVAGKVVPGERRQRMTQAERTAVSDRRMFDAAIALILERGTQNTTLKEVGERAGYSRGLASNRFGSKDALFQKLVQDFNGKWAEDLRSAIGDRTGLEAIMGALDCVEQYLIEQPHQMKAMYTLWYESFSGQSALRRRTDVTPVGGLKRGLPTGRSSPRSAHRGSRSSSAPSSSAQSTSGWSRQSASTCGRPSRITATVSPRPWRSALLRTARDRADDPNSHLLASSN